MRAAIVLILATMCIGEASAQKEKSGSMGFGVRSCAEFAKDYQQQPQTAELLYFAWGQGYMTAQNVWRFGPKIAQRDLNSQSVSQQMAFIRNYCNGKPLAYYTEAVNALFNSMDEIPP